MIFKPQPFFLHSLFCFHFLLSIPLDHSQRSCSCSGRCLCKLVQQRPSLSARLSFLCSVCQAITKLIFARSYFNHVIPLFKKFVFFFFFLNEETPTKSSPDSVFWSLVGGLAEPWLGRRKLLPSQYSESKRKDNFFRERNKIQKKIFWLQIFYTYPQG